MQEKHEVKNDKEIVDVLIQHNNIIQSLANKKDSKASPKKPVKKM